MSRGLFGYENSLLRSCLPLSHSLLGDLFLDGLLAMWLALNSTDLKLLAHELNRFLRGACGEDLAQVKTP